MIGKIYAPAPRYAPVNLLDNSNFRNPVNQRGAASPATKAGEYPFDRWKINSGAWAFDASGLTMTSVGNIQQRLAYREDWVGKPFTRAIYYADGGIRVNTSPLPVGTNGTYFYLNIAPEQNRAIKAFALYEGTYTAETLPLYVPRPYSVELAECRRWFLPLDASKWYEATRPYGDTLRFEVLGDFARAPTLTGSIRGFGDDGIWHDMAISSVEYRQDRTIFRIPGSSSFAKTGVTYLLTGASGVSCEL